MHRPAASAALGIARRNGSIHLYECFIRRPNQDWKAHMPMRALLILLAILPLSLVSPAAADNPELIFKKTTVWKFLSPDHKLATYALDDPLVQGVACHFTVPEKGGWSGWLGLAEELSNASLACRQIGPIQFKEKFEQGDDMFRLRRSFFFKKMQIVRGCDKTRNVLVYLVYTDKLIEGSPENSTSTVPIMPWGTTAETPRCGDWVTD
jgi:CreA protein